MVGCNTVPEKGEHSGICDIRKCSGLLRHVLEERRMLNVGRPDIPLVSKTCDRFHLLPGIGAGENIPVTLPEHFGDYTRTHGIRNLLIRWPNVLEIDRITIAAFAERFAGDIDPGIPGDGVCHHENRRGEIIHLRLRIHATFEVSVPRQNGADDQVTVRNGTRNRIIQRSGVADTSGAAVPDKIEAQCVQSIL